MDELTSAILNATSIDGQLDALRAWLDAGRNRLELSDAWFRSWGFSYGWRGKPSVLSWCDGDGDGVQVLFLDPDGEPRIRRYGVAERRGDWGQVSSSRRFWPLDPRPQDVDLNDIARGLSRICRFNGHTRDFYSVAQHSIHVLSLVFAELRDRDVFADEEWFRSTLLWALLHDGPEAYIGDKIRPLKRQPEMAAFRDVDALIMEAICCRFELRPEMPPEVKRADDCAVVTEARDLMYDPEWARAATDRMDESRILKGSRDFEEVEAMFICIFHALDRRDYEGAAALVAQGW